MEYSFQLNSSFRAAPRAAESSRRCSAPPENRAVRGESASRAAAPSRLNSPNQEAAVRPSPAIYRDSKVFPGLPEPRRSRVIALRSITIQKFRYPFQVYTVNSIFLFAAARNTVNARFTKRISNLLNLVQFKSTLIDAIVLNL